MAAKLYRVVGPTFVAGFLTSDTGLSIQDAAPIIRYFKGKSMVFAADYCRQRRWKLELCNDPSCLHAGEQSGP